MDELVAPPIFEAHGRMNLPGFSCAVCKRPLAPQDRYRQDNRIVCERHVRDHSYRYLDAASESHSEDFEADVALIIGGRTGPG